MSDVHVSHGYQWKVRGPSEVSISGPRGEDLARPRDSSRTRPDGGTAWRRRMGVMEPAHSELGLLLCDHTSPVALYTWCLEAAPVVEPFLGNRTTWAGGTPAGAPEVCFPTNFPFPLHGTHAERASVGNEPILSALRC